MTGIGPMFLTFFVLKIIFGSLGESLEGKGSKERILDFIS